MRRDGRYGWKATIQPYKFGSSLFVANKSNCVSCGWCGSQNELPELQLASRTYFKRFFLVGSNLGFRDIATRGQNETDHRARVCVLRPDPPLVLLDDGAANPSPSPPPERSRPAP